MNASWNGGDDLVIVTGNQPALQRDVQLSFAIPANFSPSRKCLAAEDRQQAQAIEKSRARFEKRTLTTITALSVDWRGAKQLLRLERETVRQGKRAGTVGYTITTLDRRRVSTDSLLRWWRGRWDIENRDFWIKDTAQREDDYRVREGSAPRILGLFRNTNLNSLRASTPKTSQPRCEPRPSKPHIS